MKKLMGVLAVAFAALGFVGSAGAANGDALRQIIIDRSGTSCASYDAACADRSSTAGTLLVATPSLYLVSSAKPLFYSTYDPIILSMTANPEPLYTFRHWSTERAVMQPNPNTAVLPVSSSV